jgi:hypothetical protein
MTQEEKELLLKDLCARLPYGVKIQTWYGEIITSDLNTFPYSTEEMDKEGMWGQLNNFKPYLRPMSSMTEDEKKKIQALYHENTQNVFKDPDEVRGYRFYDISVVDWLNENHFDYRGLIEKGLALEAPEGMYKNE